MSATSPTRTCALLTLEDMGHHIFDDDLLLPPLGEAGFIVESVPWRRDEDWSRFDCVVVRTTWDYHKDAERFVEVLERIQRQTRLFNPFELLRWNIDKSYLADLERRGVPVVPTLFGRDLDHAGLQDLRRRLGTDLVIKPTVSAGADNTFRLDASASGELLAQVARCFARRAYMAQPFMGSVVEHGELSLFYFSGVRGTLELSHTVLKVPKAGDFRVQEEHGGRLRLVEADASARAVAETTLAALDETPLYARVDLVREKADGVAYRLMELELIEPSLYLRYAPQAADAFAGALKRRLAS